MPNKTNQQKMKYKGNEIKLDIADLVQWMWVWVQIVGCLSTHRHLLLLTAVIYYSDIGLLKALDLLKLIGFCLYMQWLLAYCALACIVFDNASGDYCQ